MRKGSALPGGIRKASLASCGGNWGTEACLPLSHSVPGTLRPVTRLVTDTRKELPFTV